MPDPATISMIMAAIGPILQGFMGNKGKMGSTFNEGQLGMLGDVLNQVKGMGQQGNIQNNQAFQGGQNWLQDLFNDPQFFQNFEAPLQRQFQEDIGPGIANRYAGMGSGGSLGSTGFRNQIAREGSNLSTNIAALRGGMQQQGANQALGYGQAGAGNYMQMLQQALQPTQNVYQQSSIGF